MICISCFFSVFGKFSVLQLQLVPLAIRLMVQLILFVLLRVFIAAMSASSNESLLERLPLDIRLEIVRSMGSLARKRWKSTNSINKGSVFAVECEEIKMHFQELINATNISEFEIHSQFELFRPVLASFLPLHLYMDHKKKAMMRGHCVGAESPDPSNVYLAFKTRNMVYLPHSFPFLLFCFQSGSLLSLDVALDHNYTIRIPQRLGLITRPNTMEIIMSLIKGKPVFLEHPPINRLCGELHVIRVDKRWYLSSGGLWHLYDYFGPPLLSVLALFLCNVYYGFLDHH